MPPVVADEITPSLKVRLSWITVRPLAAHIEPRVLRATLDLGERDAISLAIEQSARLIILDDLAARKMAEGVGLPVVGTLGILVRAKQRGLLAAVQPNLDTLVAVGFYIGPDLRRRILSDAGEGGS